MVNLWLRQLGASLAALAALCVSLDSHAARIPFPDEKVSYELQGQTLKDFLQRLFDDVGIPVNVSPLLQEETGTLNGPRSGGAASVFKSIADSNGLVAYYDGSVAFVYKNREISSRYFQIDPARVDAFRESTVGFGLTDANDTFQIKQSTGMVAASGTPRFLEQVAQLSSALIRRARATPPAAPSQSRTTLRLIDLKYAWAADTTYTIGNQRTVIPGVATILKQLLGQQDSSFGSQGSGTSSAAVGGLRGKGLAALGDRLANMPQGAPRSGGVGYSAVSNSTADNGDESTSRQAAPAVSALLDNSESPHIVADPYRNAQIIRDTPDRMAMYEDLVQKLDVESQIIQLEATVIDIDRNNVQQLGIDWAYQHGNTSVAFGGGVHPVDAAGNLAGLQVNSIISNASNFVARVNALATTGVTNIVQRPQVVTLNDVEAVIESTQSVYVPVSGAFDEDLFGVMAGTVLRVTPHMIADNGRQRIRLLVSIEDGTVAVNNQSTVASNGQSVVQAVPTVTNNAVNTQAIIDSGQGLLLGGLTRHETDKTSARIPILGSIPLLGHLFRSDTTTRNNTERLFLISPRIIVATSALVPEPGKP